MKVLVAPDRYGVELSAAEAAEAVARGWLRSAPYDEVDLLPLSDGGPGFVDVLSGALVGDLGVVTVSGPLGDPVPARVLRVGSTAYVEAAEAAGLHLVAVERRDAEAAGSAGVGELLLAAAATGAERIVVGVGGTAGTDGGRGLLTALEGRRDELGGRELVVATATDAPLMGHSGAAHGFAAAKGADRAARDRLEERLRAWATETDGGLAVRPGAGAGGGIGFALMLLGAERVNGTELVAGLTGLDARVRAADLAVTALGALDWEALRGRVVVGVTQAAQRAGRPTVVLAGRVDVGRRELASVGVDGAYAADEVPLGEDALDAGDLLAVLAARVARTWSR
ncbi:MAG TPA: glycerate kinase [Actinomycetes bacterium]|nr:glycerate kinase [Actinomycetes bacterium]